MAGIRGAEYCGDAEMGGGQASRRDSVSNSLLCLSCPHLSSSAGHQWERSYLLEKKYWDIIPMCFHRTQPLINLVLEERAYRPESLLHTLEGDDVH